MSIFESHTVGSIRLKNRQQEPISSSVSESALCIMYVLCARETFNNWGGQRRRVDPTEGSQSCNQKEKQNWIQSWEDESHPSVWEPSVNIQGVKTLICFVSLEQKWKIGCKCSVDYIQ